MKALVVLAFVVLVAATALAYGGMTNTSGVTSAAAQVAGASEPAALLLSGGLLLGLAGAVKRFTL